MRQDSPILYSFRRCPYAMRARMGLAYAGISVRLREVDLKNKPKELLGISPKGTVPVLQISKNQILEQSLDILGWALQQADPDGWTELTLEQQTLAEQLIAENDGNFKNALNRYKYPHRFDLAQGDIFREEGLQILKKWSHLLEGNGGFLLKNCISYVDIALFPFVRQFARNDEVWFGANAPQALQRWLAFFLNHALFEEIMVRHDPWQPGNPEVFLFDSSLST